MKIDEHVLIRLGMYTNELERLRDKYGFWVQNAEVYIPSQADSIATISAGGGEYTVMMESK